MKYNREKHIKKILIALVFLFLLFSFIFSLKTFNNQVHYSNITEISSLRTNEIDDTLDLLRDEFELQDDDEDDEDDDEEDKSEGDGGSWYDFIKNIGEYSLDNLDSLILIGSAIAISAYSYRKIKKMRAAKRLELERAKDKSLPPKSIKKGIDFPTEQKSIVEVLDEEKAIAKLLKMGDVNITVLSDVFFDVINSFEWDGGEKEAFIQEMKALTPSERDLILSKMLEKSV